MFTDVEGSTRLLEEIGTDGYAAVLAVHHRVCREAWAAHGGVEVDTAGDAFFVAFAQASDALSAAAAAQEALVGVGVRVRMGVHTGEATLTPTGYVGLAVHRAARIAGAAHGGQVVVSASTRALVADGFPLVDLGEHRFKDLGAPERVFQLGEDAFPPLRCLHRTNLPTPATPFLGREAELATIRAMLGETGVRVVSLVGPGGTGKTRLALQAAAEAADAFPDGVFWAPLAPLRDPALFLSAVASALSVIEGNDTSPVEDLSRALAGRRLLVFIDNLEHLLPEAAEALDAFVAACPTVTTVVTTRERLRLPAERVYAVPPMNEVDGEALFRSRSAAVGIDLPASKELRELCARLDNLPLALELAAARTVVFSPVQLLDRIAQRLDLPKADRGVHPRQATLRATIAWSHDLLDHHEQQLFRRLSAFRGGCDYDAAEDVAGAEPDTLQSLLDKSLLRRRDSARGPRYGMLETLREYATEQLLAAGEIDMLHRRHLAHYASVAKSCFDDTLAHHDYDRLLEERENLRLALDLALKSDPGRALELAAWLFPLWDESGETREGRKRITAALEGAPDTRTHARAYAYAGAAALANNQRDLEAADGLALEALARFEELGDHRGAGWALIERTKVAFVRGDYSRVRRMREAATKAYRRAGAEDLDVRAAGFLSIMAAVEGDYTTAVTLGRETVAGLRRGGTSRGLAQALNNLGTAEEASGDKEQARRSFEESIAISRERNDKQLLALALAGLSHLDQGTAPAEALARYTESLELAREVEDPLVIAYCLQGCAVVYAAGGDPGHAASLLAAASSISAHIGAALTGQDRAEVHSVQKRCRDALSPEEFARAWNDGAALDADAAADLALRIWERARTGESQVGA